MDSARMDSRLRQLGGNALEERGGRWALFFVVLILTGAGAFLFGLLGEHPLRFWQAYLVNLVYWTGMAAGMVLFSTILILTKARWGRPLKRIAEAPVLFLPVAFLLFWPLFFGRETIFPWVVESFPKKAAWLNTPAFFIREGGVLLLLAVVALLMIRQSVRADRKALSGAGPLTEAWEKDRIGDRQMVWANIYGILYALILTVIAFDLIMSLNPDWFSNLFGAYYFVGSFFTALAGLFILAVIAVKSLGLGDLIRPVQFHNLGKLLLGFALMTGDFFYVQFFVMWYGNLPSETKYIIERVRLGFWEPIAWTVLLAAFAFPFVVLLSRPIKMKPWPMVAICLVILTAMWLERFLLVVPSVWKAEWMPLGIPELLITAGFFGVMGLCVLIFLRRTPLAPVADPLFHAGISDQKAGGERGHV